MHRTDRFVNSNQLDLGLILVGIPHRATEDDSYGGYDIPKDSLILPHMWYVLFTDLISPISHVFMITGTSPTIPCSIPRHLNSDQKDS